MTPKDPIRLTNERLWDGALTATVTAAPLSIEVRGDVHSILVQADPDNAADVFIGNETSQSIQLAAGDTWQADLNSLTKVYVRAAAGTERVNWHAVGGA